ncbi:ThuA domain-containing protein [Rubrobacter aplysinae]|uniref:ThuA domain-containing protein n=1 Tax=Rubrobacter aplysinae TaxID=909625 RepID=UPI00064B8440|nr:ThuA domain-containing protein [Rubrobacter aplysinae]
MAETNNTPRGLRVTVWNEYRHERDEARPAELYPGGIHATLSEALREGGLQNVRTATLDEPEHGLTEEALAETDVLLWWGHRAHAEVSEEVVDRVHRRVLGGMGLIVLHSGHFAKIFQRLLGTTCSLKWRHDDRERLWVVDPAHPIVEGLGEYVDLPEEEMYGEPFDVPPPEELVFVSWFGGGEVFRSGLCYRRGRGRIFYFRPGHEENPSYHHPEVRRIVNNAVRWAAPRPGAAPTHGNTEPPESPGNS